MFFGASGFFFTFYLGTEISIQLEVNKNELVGVMNTQGELVCRTSLIETFRSMQIIGKGNNCFLDSRPGGCTSEMLLFELSYDGYLAIDGPALLAAFAARAPPACPAIASAPADACVLVAFASLRLASGCALACGPLLGKTETVMPKSATIRS